MKLTQDQKNAIKNEFFKTVKNSEMRSKIISIAYGFAHENGEDGDIESMVLFLMDKENADKIDELFNEFANSIPYTPEIEQISKKDKK